LLQRKTKSGGTGSYAAVMTKRVVMSWSGGKDSALALAELLDDPTVQITALLTTVTETYERVSMHGVRIELLGRQAAAINLPLIQVWIPPACVNETYEARMAAAYEHPLMVSADAVASGDLFLEDVRAYREERIREAGKEPLFPVWGRPTDHLARSCIDRGFEAVLTCVDPKQLDSSFCGRPFDADFLSSLPDHVDPCGENGEFHTFVHRAPFFSKPIKVVHGEVVERDGFFFAEFVPEPSRQLSSAC
jgi:uncharacterized protein (TIGR00290 family)